MTIVQAGPVVVTQIKTHEKDGYEAVQVGFASKKIKNITKPQLGHLRKAISDTQYETRDEKYAPRYLREVKIQSPITDHQSPNVGDVIKVTDVLVPGDVVKVTGVSKGKGFQGGVRRWGFHGGPRTHGQSDRERAPGSIGQTTTPGRVMKGKKMAGRMGGEQKTVWNLVVLDATPDGVVKLSGPVPGPIRGLLQIEKVGHDERFEVDEVEKVEKVDEGGNE